MSKKVYLYKETRVELGLDPGYTYDKDGNLVPFGLKSGKSLIDLNDPPKPISYERLQELMKEHDSHERTDGN